MGTTDTNSPEKAMSLKDRRRSLVKKICEPDALIVRFEGFGSVMRPHTHIEFKGDADQRTFDVKNCDFTWLVRNDYIAAIKREWAHVIFKSTPKCILSSNSLK